MNYALISSGQVHAAADLAEAVADRYGCVGVISRAAVGTAALLDQTAQELSGRRIRCVRVQGPAAGGLGSRDLIAQIVARPDPGTLTDADLKAGFKALTEPGEGFRRVALLVSEAHGLLPSAVRYVQLARQASPAKLCVVLAGKPGLATVLEGEDFIPLRSAMHMMELPEPAGAGLFDHASALPEPPVPRAGGSSPLVRLGLAASIIPIVGLIWWRHLPEMPAATVPPPDAPSVSASVNAPSARLAASPPDTASAERAGEPAPPEPGSPASPQVGSGPAADPVPPVAAVTPEPPAFEAAAPEAPAEQSADVAEPPNAAESLAAAEPPATAEPPAPEPSAAVATEPAAPTAELPAAPAAEPSAVPPERGEAPAPEADLAELPAPRPAPPAPDAAPPAPEPAIAAKPPAPPQPHGTLTVTTALPAQGGVRRAAPPVAVPQAAAPPARPAEDRPSLADEKRCRTIVFRAQLGKDPSDADKQFLRNGCRSG